MSGAGATGLVDHLENSTNEIECDQSAQSSVGSLGAPGYIATHEDANTNYGSPSEGTEEHLVRTGSARCSRRITALLLIGSTELWLPNPALPYPTLERTIRFGSFGHTIPIQRKVGMEQEAAIIQVGMKHANSFLSFNIASSTHWTTDDNITNEQMMKDIVAYKQRHEGIHLPNRTIETFRDDFILPMSIDENVGFQNRSSMVAGTQEYETQMTPNDINNRNVREQTKSLEHTNMLKAWSFLDSRRENQQGILSVDFILEVHKILMKDLRRNAGQLSIRGRSTECPVTERVVDYPEPGFIDTVLPTLLDYVNYITVYLKEKIDNGVNEEIVLEMVKFFAWFFSSLVQLHPFGDGNGRLSRLLYYYLQSFLTPIAVGIYKSYAPTKKIDYYKALAEVREHTRTALSGETNKFKENNWRFDNQPALLARMILECQWYAWKKFDSDMNEAEITRDK